MFKRPASTRTCTCADEGARAGGRYLSEVVFKRPVICYDYPKEIKAFYMRLNEDGKTVPPPPPLPHP